MVSNHLHANNNSNNFNSNDDASDNNNDFNILEQNKNKNCTESNNNVNHNSDANNNNDNFEYFALQKTQQRSQSASRVRSTSTIKNLKTSKTLSRSHSTSKIPTTTTEESKKIIIARTTNNENKNDNNNGFVDYHKIEVDNNNFNSKLKTDLYDGNNNHNDNNDNSNNNSNDNEDNKLKTIDLTENFSEVEKNSVYKETSYSLKNNIYAQNLQIFSCFDAKNDKKNDKKNYNTNNSTNNIAYSYEVDKKIDEQFKIIKELRKKCLDSRFKLYQKQLENLLSVEIFFEFLQQEIFNNKNNQNNVDFSNSKQSPNKNKIDKNLEIKNINITNNTYYSADNNENKIKVSNNKKNNEIISEEKEIKFDTKKSIDFKHEPFINSIINKYENKNIINKIGNKKYILNNERNVENNKDDEFYEQENQKFVYNIENDISEHLNLNKILNNVTEINVEKNGNFTIENFERYK
jgi:hypothetical protein